jgi:hypothetical protein
MASPADTPASAPASDVVVARTVIVQMRELPPIQAASVVRAIHTIGEVGGEPIRFEAEGIPPGTSHFALAPDDDQAPVIIYRTVPGETGKWRVTTLLSRDDYREYREAERRGLLDDPTVQTLIKASAIIGAAVVGGMIANRAVRPQAKDPNGKAPRGYADGPASPPTA